MNLKNVFYKNLNILLISFLFLGGMKLSVHAQSTYNVNNRTLVFLAANKIHKVGTDGSSAGNKTLYTNVITIGSQQIDCIVTTVSIVNGSFTLPASPASGTIPFDYSSNSGSGMSANEDSFFSPTINWNSGGGKIRFNFQFISGGTYNNSTNSGTNVILNNVFVNTYDIDGNGSTGSYQYNEFGGFSNTQFQTLTGGYIQSVFDFPENKTKFRSTTSSNISTITDDRTRVKVFYNSLSSFDFIVGAEGSGAAYYFIDFGQGPAWTNTPAVQVPPVLDLDPSGSSYDRYTDVSICNQSNSFAYNGTNVTSSANIDTLFFSFSTSDIVDGGSEKLIIDSATSGGSIALNFSNNARISNVVLSGTTYSVKAKVSGGISKLLFYKSAGTMTNVESEKLVSSFIYLNNNCIALTIGLRTFELEVFQIPFMSNVVKFEVNIIAPLPLRFIDFKTYQRDGLSVLYWKVADDFDAASYAIQGSDDANIFYTINNLKSFKKENTPADYQFIIPNNVNAKFYRIVATKTNGNIVTSSIVYLNVTSSNFKSVAFPNPINTNTSSLQIDMAEPFDGIIQIVDIQGKVHYSKAIESISDVINLEGLYLQKGVYYVQLIKGGQLIRAIVLKAE
jgi:hypothetical protein